MEPTKYPFKYNCLTFGCESNVLEQTSRKGEANVSPEVLETKVQEYLYQVYQSDLYSNYRAYSYVPSFSPGLITNRDNDAYLEIDLSKIKLAKKVGDKWEFHEWKDVKKHLLNPSEKSAFKSFLFSEYFDTEPKIISPEEKKNKIEKSPFNFPRQDVSQAIKYFSAKYSKKSYWDTQAHYLVNIKKFTEELHQYLTWVAIHGKEATHETLVDEFPNNLAHFAKTPEGQYIWDCKIFAAMASEIISQITIEKDKPLFLNIKPISYQRADGLASVEIPGHVILEALSFYGYELVIDNTEVILNSDKENEMAYVPTLIDGAGIYSGVAWKADYQPGYRPHLLPFYYKNTGMVDNIFYTWDTIRNFTQKSGLISSSLVSDFSYQNHSDISRHFYSECISEFDQEEIIPFHVALDIFNNKNITWQDYPSLKIFIYNLFQQVEVSERSQKSLRSFVENYNPDPADRLKSLEDIYPEAAKKMNLLKQNQCVEFNENEISDLLIYSFSSQPIYEEDKHSISDYKKEFKEKNETLLTLIEQGIQAGRLNPDLIAEDLTQAALRARHLTFGIQWRLLAHEMSEKEGLRGLSRLIGKKFLQSSINNEGFSFLLLNVYQITNRSVIDQLHFSTSELATLYEFSRAMASKNNPSIPKDVFLYAGPAPEKITKEERYLRLILASKAGAWGVFKTLSKTFSIGNFPEGIPSLGISKHEMNLEFLLAQLSYEATKVLNDGYDSFNEVHKNLWNYLKENDLTSSDANMEIQLRIYQILKQVGEEEKGVKYIKDHGLYDPLASYVYEPERTERFSHVSFDEANLDSILKAMNRQTILRADYYGDRRPEFNVYKDVAKKYLEEKMHPESEQEN